VVAISGILIFFEIGPGSVRATHEWLSIVFVSVSLLHIYNHKKPFIKYFTNNNRYFILAGVLFGCALFIASFNDIYSADAAFEKISNAKIDHLAPIFNVSTQELISELKHAGIRKASPGLSLNEIAELNNIDIYGVIEPLWLIDPK